MRVNEVYGTSDEADLHDLKYVICTFEVHHYEAEGSYELSASFVVGNKL